MYRGLPDEDFSQKKMHFLSSLELARIVDEEDRLAALPFILADHSSLTYRTERAGNIGNVEDALEKFSSIFLSDEARRANDTEWESLNLEYMEKTHGTSTK